MATLPEKLSRAKAWSRLLFGIIPEQDLRAVFEAAFVNHTGTFPINAYDLKDAWEEFDEQRRSRLDHEAWERRQQEIWDKEFGEGRDDH